MAGLRGFVAGDEYRLHEHFPRLSNMPKHDGLSRRALGCICRAVGSLVGQSGRDPIVAREDRLSSYLYYCMREMVGTKAA